MKKEKKDIKSEEKNDQTEQETEEMQNLHEEAVEEQADKDKRIAELESEAADLKDKLLRKAAEFENYKRRNENDQLNLIRYAAESFIVKLLPVIDDFERSLQHLDNSKDVESIKQGVNLIYDKLMKVLDEQGVKKIDAVGQPFDVNFHDALMQRRDENAAPHTVLEEVEKGYMYKDRVIRHSKVIVNEDREGHRGNENPADGNNEE